MRIPVVILIFCVTVKPEFEISSVQVDGASTGARNYRENQPPMAMYPWSCTSCVENDMAMWKWFQRQIRHMKYTMERTMERRIEEKISSVHSELNTKMESGFSDMRNHLELKVTRTYSDPRERIHVFESTDSLCINVHMLPHRSKSTSVPPFEWMHPTMPTYVHSSQSLRDVVSTVLSIQFPFANTNCSVSYLFND